MSNDPNLESKAELRTRLTAARANRAASLTADDRVAAATRVAKNVLAEPLVAPALASGRTVASYLPLDSEPDTTALHAQLMSRGIRVLLPECVTNNADAPTMAWIELDAAITDANPSANQPRRDNRGIPIPQGRRVGVGAQGLAHTGCQLILVPALAVTKDGRRLGKGAGYYDRLLDELSTHFERDAGPTSVAIVFTQELLDSVPTEPHDAPVSTVVTV